MDNLLRLLIAMLLPKTHRKYWEDKLKRRRFRYRDGRTYESPNYQVRITVNGKAQWFNLGSANKQIASIKAKEIWLYLQEHGGDGTLEKFKPANGNSSTHSLTNTEEPTVGRFLTEIEQLRLIKPRTFTSYSRKFRRLVAGAMGIRSGNSKYDYVGKGNLKWRKKVDDVLLSVLTPEKIRAWRAKYLRLASQAPLSQQRAITTLNSILRNSKTLFSTKYLNQLSFKVQSN